MMGKCIASARRVAAARSNSAIQRPGEARNERTINRSSLSSSSAVHRKHTRRVCGGRQAVRAANRPNELEIRAHVVHVKRDYASRDSSRYASKKIASTTKRFGLAEFPVNFPSSCVMYPAPTQGSANSLGLPGARRCNFRRLLHRATSFDTIVRPTDGPTATHTFSPPLSS